MFPATFLSKHSPHFSQRSLIGSTLAFFGVDSALFLAFIAFLLNFIPTVGSVFSAFPALLIVSIQFDGFTPILYVGILYIGINLLIGTLIEPLIIGGTLGLSPLVVMISLAFWTYLLGIVGAFMCVPLTSVALIILQNSDSKNLRNIALLFGRAPDDIVKTLINETPTKSH